MNRDKKWNILSLLVCVVLAVFLIGMLAWGKKADAAESRRLEQIAKEQENPAPEKEIKEAEEAKVEGIVCWGDDMVNGEASATHSYKVVLQNLLKEKGYNLPVQDKTLQGAGTLSMMTMAGVPEEEVQQFITKHQEAAAGAELAITETGIRDLTEEQKARTDLNCIPVICMGYYGGWSHDPAELAEQQQKILATFPNQDKFLIVGAIPLDGSVNEETLDQVLSEKWGEHYISAAQVSSSPAATYEGQEAIANAVVQKLEELNYIHKEG